MAVVKKQQMKLVDDEPRKDIEVDQEVQNTFQYNIVKEALSELVSATMEYLECKDKFEWKKATLQTKTDWGEALPLTNRPTVADKEAYIVEVTHKYKEHLRALQVDKMYKEELYKIELLRYEKE